MKKICALLMAMHTLIAYAQSDFSVSKSGLLYKIVKGTDTVLIKDGDIVQYTLVQKFGDSTVRDSRESGNAFNKIEMQDQPFSETEVLRMMAVGDSAIVKISTDSIYNFYFNQAKQQNVTEEMFKKQVPDFIAKKGEFINVSFLLLKKYPNDSLAMLDFEKEKPKMQAYQEKMQREAKIKQEAIDKIGFVNADKEFTTFMETKPKNLKKTASGTFVQIIKPGTGALCLPGATAKVRYKCMSLTGYVYDTNYPKDGEPVKPTFDVTVNGGGSIIGFGEGVASLRKGATALLYVPTKAAYTNVGQGDIGPYTNLMFEIMIEDVIPKVVPKPIAKTPVKKVPVKKAPVKKPIKKK